MERLNKQEMRTTNYPQVHYTLDSWIRILSFKNSKTLIEKKISWNSY